MRKFQQYITEGVYDPSIFKAFFLGGGPGSGKSWVSARVLSGMGLKVINSDNAFFSKLKREKMTLDFDAHDEKEIKASCADLLSAVKRVSIFSNKATHQIAIRAAKGSATITTEDPEKASKAQETIDIE